MTQAEFDDIVKATCPHCAAGTGIRQRTDNAEWVHDYATIVGPLSRRQGHTICMATHLRNSSLSEGLT